jgi:hypothetical protein
VESTAATTGIGSWIGKHPRRFVCLLLAGALIAGLVVYLTRSQPITPAPTPRLLPLATGATRIAARAGRGDVDAALPRRYRYIPIAGPQGSSRGQLIEAEVNLLRTRGWSGESSVTFSNDTATPARAAPINTPGAVVSINGPDGLVYAAMSTASTMGDVNSSLLDGNRAIAAALREQRPVLVVTLGNLHH